MSAEHVLTTPELLPQIFSYASKSAVAAGMQVCSLWAAVGKPFLWEVLDSEGDLEGLLRILVPWEYIPFQTEVKIPTHPNWDYFLQVSHLVRHITVHQNDVDHTMDTNIAFVLDFLANSRPSAEIFPNLRSFECSARQHPLLRSSMTLLHPGVQRFVHQLTFVYKLARNLYPVEQLRNITYLEFGANFRPDPGMVSVVASLRHLQRLAIIVFPTYSITIPVLEALSSYPALRDIQTRHDGYERVKSRNCDGDHSVVLVPPLPNPSFPVLDAIVMTGCPYHLTALVDDEHFPSQIRSLTIERLHCSENWTQLHAKIIEKCARLARIDWI